MTVRTKERKKEQESATAHVDSVAVEGGDVECSGSEQPEITIIDDESYSGDADHQPKDNEILSWTEDEIFEDPKKSYIANLRLINLKKEDLEPLGPREATSSVIGRPGSPPPRLKLPYKQLWYRLDRVADRLMEQREQQINL